MPHCSRRNFLKTGLAAGALAGIGGFPLKALAPEKATDWVTLGKSGVKVTRLAFGTGSMSGKVQRDLGQDSTSWCGTAMTTACVSLKPLSLTAICTACWELRSRASHATATV